MRRAGVPLWIRLALGALAGLALSGCQGTNQNFRNPQPRSKEAGENELVPAEAKTTSKQSVDTDGGELHFRHAKLTIPVGGVTEPVFVELSEPDTPPEDVIGGSPVLINPQGTELKKDALLSISYRDSDIPRDRLEGELAIVESVNSVWVPLPNSRVLEHENKVEAPVRYFGLYALQFPSLDSRQSNAEPVASFEWSDKPITGMFSPAPHTKKLPAVQQPAAGAGTAPQPGQPGYQLYGPQPPGAGAPPAQGQGGGGQSGGGQGGAPPANPPNPPPTGSTAPHSAAYQFDREIVAGPEDASMAGPSGPAGNAAEAQAGGKKKSASQAGGAGQAAGSQGSAAQNPPATPPGNSTAAGPNTGGQQNTAESKPGPPPKSAEELAAESLDEAAEMAAALKADDDLTFYFDASASYDPDGEIVEYDWDFDSDGIFDYSSHRGPFATHRFAHNGDYTVVLKVTDNGRYPRVGFATQVISVRSAEAPPSALMANISSYPPEGPVPLTVRFASSITGGSPPYKYNWSFADGGQSDLPNPFTTYPTIADRTVTFGVADQRGDKLNGSLLVHACDCAAPAEGRGRIDLDILPHALNGKPPYKAEFSMAPQRSTAPVVYRVTFGDEAPGAPPYETTKLNISHVYSTPGFYILSVLATDADLRTSSSFATVDVSGRPNTTPYTASQPAVGGDPYSFGHSMHIGFDYGPQSTRTVNFQVLQPPAGGQLGYQWDFGDGTYSTDVKPQHTYANDGVFEVKLTANDGVQLYRHRIWLPVSTKDPAAAIESSEVVEGVAPLKLTWDAVVTRADQPLKYDWDFSGEHRGDASAYYAFNTPGDYEVGLTVKDKWGDAITASPVAVHVRGSTRDYRQPLVVIDRSEGGNRAVVLDYDAAAPMPLSSPDVEGPVSGVDLSSDGEYAAVVGEDGLLVKRVADGQPVAVFLPAVGKVASALALEGGSAYATVTSAEGLRTYLVRAGAAPLLIASGAALDASRGGSVVVVKRSGNPDELADAAVVSVDPLSGRAGDPQPIGKLYEAKLTGNGGELFYITGDNRLARRNLASGKVDDVSPSTDRKYALSVSTDGSAVAFVAQRGDAKKLMYGSRQSGGDFELTSVTDQTGFFSDSVGLGNDGRYLLAYGSRDQLRKMLSEASKSEVPVKAVEAANTEAAAAKIGGVGGTAAANTGGAPSSASPPHTERVGVIRFDMSADPQSWSITTLKPRFVIDSSRQFDTAGPF